MEQREGIVGVSRSSSARDRRSQLILITWVNGFYVIGNWSGEGRVQENSGVGGCKKFYH